MDKNPKVNDFNAGAGDDEERISRGGQRFDTNEFQANKMEPTKRAPADNTGQTDQPARHTDAGQTDSNPVR